MADGDNGLDELARPQWDEKKAAALVGKCVVIGITRFEADRKTLISKEQMHGVISNVDPKVGITVSLRGKRDGETCVLPPHLQALNDASPGDYRLRETGEVVSNPDLTSTWEIFMPKN